MPATPPIVDQQTWRAALADLRIREKAATRELDAIAAQLTGLSVSAVKIGVHRGLKALAARIRGSA